MRKVTSWLANEEDGQGLTEYSLVIALVSIALVVGLSGMKDALLATFQGIQNALVKVASGVKP